MNVATSRGTRKATRDLIQAIAAVAASGGTVALVEVIAGSVDPVWGVVLAFFFKVLFAFVQNWAETAGKVPVLLPTPGLVPSSPLDPLAEKTVGTVETVVERVGDTVGDVTGTVTGVAGEILGEVTGRDEMSIQDRIDQREREAEED